MKNQVIKALNKEHGKKVIQYWKDRGVNTVYFEGLDNEEEGCRFIYYGLINGQFGNWTLKQVQEANAEIIELPNEEIKEESIFKVGDKVFDYAYGWGKVVHVSENEDDEHPIQVDFLSDTTDYYNNQGCLFNKTKIKTLSFTEYTLQGFSQERPIELPKVGELCLMRDSNEDRWECKVFYKYTINPEGNIFVTDQGEGFNQMKRIKILD